MNNYKITNINTDTNAVYVVFTYGEAQLNHTFFVEDVNNEDEITKSALEHYQKFQEDIDLANSKPQLAPEVASLIDEVVEVK